jgi:hypothetical protein
MKRVIAALTMLLLMATSPASASTGETLIDTWAEPTLSGVTTDGRFVVWSKQYGGASQGTDVYAHDLTSGETRIVASPRAGLWAFNDGVVVWAFTAGYHNLPPEFFGVFARSLITGEEYVISGEANASSVGTSSGIVGWSTGSELDRMYRYRSIDGQTEPEDIPRLNVEHEQLAVRHDNGLFVWIERDPASTDSSVVSWTPGEDPRVITTGKTITSLTVTGSSVMFIESGRLNQVEISSGERVEIEPAWDVAPAYVVTDGRYLFWQTKDPEQHKQRIMAHDLLTSSTFTAVEFQLPEDEMFGGGLRQGGADGGILTWGVVAYSSPMLSEVHATTIASLLPTAPQPQGLEDEKQTYYEVTGHYLGWGFRDYWESNGGLPVFGYPLTEEFQQISDTGRFHNVQYFERERFEWHPEHVGTPYQVLLGRLGAEQARDLGLFDTEPFRFRGDDEGSDAGCLYFRETGHYTCDYFRFYWEEHGLELGDTGGSYRESLALFGYPISEPFMTTNADGHSVLTQYFERAVFEWHPENKAPYRVLLRRLGAESIVAQGW